MNTDLQPFYLHIHDAAERMQDDREDWYVPSPSGIASCRLRQWFQGTGVERTDRIPVASQKKMQSGTAIEDYWREVYTRAGFLVVSPTPPLEIGAMRSRGEDGIMFVEGEKVVQTLGLPKGASVLLELKDLGAWSYFDFIDNGVEKWSQDYWMQVQSYLHGYGRDYCIFHAGMADASGTRWIWNRIKKRPPEDLPPFWIEVIKRDASVALEAISRAGEVRHFIDNVNDRIPIELRDYDVHKLAPEGKFPCGYCGWVTACQSADRGSIRVVK